MDARLTRGPAVVAGLTGLLLLVVSGRYGYHRDELYFLACGRHLAWGYPDQPVLAPLLARIMSSISSSLVVLRLPSTISASVVVLLTGLMARDLGASRAGQLLSAGASAMTGFLLATGHLLSTATFDLLFWTVITWLVLQILQGRSPRLWIAVGVVSGIAFNMNVLVAFLLAALGICLLAFGPRSVLRGPWPWVAALVFGVMAVPYVVWQQQHGWPQEDIARSIANGGSTSSVSRPLLVPFLLLQIGPFLLPVWTLGLRRCFREPALRAFGASFVLLLVIFLVTGGKPYYLSGLVPLLMAAGAQPIIDRTSNRTAIVLVAVSTPVLFFVLPLLPVRNAGLFLAINPDTGETIAWPQFTSQMVTAAHGAPILASNYGEAGAVERFAGMRAYSGHNAFGLWGPPPGSVPVLAVGIDGALLKRSCSSLAKVGQLHNVFGIDDDEDGTELFTCRPKQPWAQLWPSFTYVG